VSRVPLGCHRAVSASRQANISSSHSRSLGHRGDLTCGPFPGQRLLENGAR
jgi:hypothetical protein